MTLFERIYEALEPLNIPLVRSFYKGDEKQYVIFSLIRDEETFVYDNENDAETYKFKLNYWFDPSCEDLTKQIQKLMKKAGFHRVYSMDNFDDGYFGTVMEFEYLMWKHEIELEPREDEEEEINH